MMEEKKSLQISFNFVIRIILSFSFILRIILEK